MFRGGKSLHNLKNIYKLSTFYFLDFYKQCSRLPGFIGKLPIPKWASSSKLEASIYKLQIRLISLHKIQTTV